MEKTAQLAIHSIPKYLGNVQFYWTRSLVLAFTSTQGNWGIEVLLPSCCRSVAFELFGIVKANEPLCLRNNHDCFVVHPVSSPLLSSLQQYENCFVSSKTSTDPTFIINTFHLLTPTTIRLWCHRGQRQCLFYFKHKVIVCECFWMWTIFCEYFWVLVSNVVRIWISPMGQSIST